MKSLQVNVNAIEQALRKVQPETVKYVLDQVTTYELSIPRIGWRWMNGRSTRR